MPTRTPPCIFSLCLRIPPVWLPWGNWTFDMVVLDTKLASFSEQGRRAWFELSLSSAASYWVKKTTHHLHSRRRNWDFSFWSERCYRHVVKMPHWCIDQAKSTFAKNSLCLLMSVVDSPLARVASLTKNKVFMTSKHRVFPNIVSDHCQKLNKTTNFFCTISWQNLWLKI